MTHTRSVERFMTKTLVVVASSATLLEARRLMTEHCVRHLPVLDADEKVVGILAERDLCFDGRLGR